MDRWNSVRWLGGCAALVLLVSGCAFEADPDDGVSWVREAEENPDLGVQGRPEWALGASSWEDFEEPTDDKAPNEGEETADPITPLTPEPDISEAREDVARPSDGLSEEASVGVFDPQPEPRSSALGNR